MLIYNWVSSFINGETNGKVKQKKNLKKIEIFGKKMKKIMKKSFEKIGKKN